MNANETETNYVEIGRVAMINYGPLCGKLAVIIDVIDQNRALVDGPYKLTGVQRQQMNFRRLKMTSLKLDIPRSCKEGRLEEAFKAADIQQQFSQSTTAQRLSVQRVKAELNDFERFKLHRVLRQRRDFAAAQIGKLKAAAK